MLEHYGESVKDPRCCVLNVWSTSAQLKEAKYRFRRRVREGQDARKHILLAS